ncbi:MAG TPA: addiction module protein [Gemmataceae bacterium]|nr:addiction module protein [Gemmataceae bacterium]
MAVTMKDLGIDRLSAEDRLALVQEIWDSLAADMERAPLTEAQRQEIDRRLAAHRANPQAAIPWEQVEAEALARLSR